MQRKLKNQRVFLLFLTMLIIFAVLLELEWTHRPIFSELPSQCIESISQRTVYYHKTKLRQFQTAITLDIRRGTSALIKHQFEWIGWHDYAAKWNSNDINHGTVPGALYEKGNDYAWLRCSRSPANAFMKLISVFSPPSSSSGLFSNIFILCLGNHSLRLFIYKCFYLLSSSVPRHRRRPRTTTRFDKIEQQTAQYSCPYHITIIT